MLGFVISLAAIALVSAGKYDHYDSDYNIPRQALGLGGSWFRNLWRNSRSDLYNDYNDYPEYSNYVNPALVSYYNNGYNNGYNNLGNVNGYPGLYNNLGGLNSGNLALYNNLVSLYGRYPGLYNSGNLGMYNNLAALYRSYPGLYNNVYNNPALYNNQGVYNWGTPYTGNLGVSSLGGNLAVNTLPAGNINTVTGGVLGYSNVPRVAVGGDAYLPRTAVIPKRKKY